MAIQKLVLHLFPSEKPGRQWRPGFYPVIQRSEWHILEDRTCTCQNRLVLHNGTIKNTELLYTQAEEYKDKMAVSLFSGRAAMLSPPGVN